MQALLQDILPPSGVEFATSLKLTPSTSLDSGPGPSTSAVASQKRALYNVVVARCNVLRVFEVREEPAPISAQADEERERRSNVRKDTDAVEGEVEMDVQGEGFVNMGSIKPTGLKGATGPPTVIRLYFVREHRLHGTVTGLESVRIMSSIEDKLDRLLVSFKDAKIALLEWSDAVHDLITVSIHTYERAPQLLSLDSSLFRAELRTDPDSRCAALLLPQDALAILPFYQTQAELDELDSSRARDVPYSPSFILDFAKDVDESIRNVADFAFLPGFNNPTVAVLFQTQQTWTGRLKEYKDTMRLFIFTLDLITRSYPVITRVEGLPYDCLSLAPCSPTLGGVVVLASNALMHVDQASRRVVLAVNGWLPRTSDMPAPAHALEAHDLHLEGSRLAFVDERTLFVVLKDGTIFPVEFFVEGKVVSRLATAGPLAQTTAPTVVRQIMGEHLFVGSTVGASVLLKTMRVEEDVVDEMDVDDASAAPAAVVDSVNTMDMDDDEDIYGSSNLEAQPAVNGIVEPSLAVKKRSVIHLSLCDSLPAWGSISDLTFSLARNGDRPVPELVAATGSGAQGGFTLFQRDLPIRTKRKIHAIGGARGVWSLPVRQAVRVNGVSYDLPTNPFHSGNDSVIISTDANPSPGLSRLSVRSPRNDLSITTRIPGTTVGAAPFFQGTAILHVLSNAIRVLEPDGTERQVIKDMDGNNYRPKIKHSSICNPFVLILREDETIGLFIGEPERGKIRRKDMSPMGEKTSRYIAGTFFSDNSGLFQMHANAAADGENGTVQPTTSTLQAAMNAGQKSQWLILCRPQGVMEIWTLPKLSLVFSTTAVASLQSLLTDSLDPPALSLPQDPPRKPQDLDIDQILIAPLGESSPDPHLFVFLRSGQLAIYSILRSEAPPDPPPAARSALLKIKFVKAFSRGFDIQPHPDEQEKSILAEHKRISRQLIPFVTAPTPETTLAGVFLTGDWPSWILATDKAGIKIHPSGHNVVHAFTACSLWESKGDFLLYTEEGPSLLEWMPGIDVGTDLPSRSVPKPRPYTNVVFDPTTCLIVAASSLQAQFGSFDEDGNQTWEPDAQNVSYPTSECSALELFTPEGWITLDGYEFANNEFVNDLVCVPLETQSTETGQKNFIAVGTTINRGEDLAVKGATYIFEIVEVVPDAGSGVKRWFKLRMRCRDEAKGPVTALCGIDGYLVSSMGQKIFVRALDMDERLVGVAFLDVGVYVTSLRAMKNLLLIGDAVKSVWFVAFQEDPYKLTILSKDIQHHCVASSDFFFTDQQLSIVTCDEEGIIRMYEYDPSDPESKNGQHLLLRTEFHGQVEYRSSVTVARRAKGKDMSVPQAKLLCGHTDGSLTSLLPVDESTFKRLHLLQGQLTRNVQHTAGLNPRAFRIVRNDFVSKPLSKGILDGNLLSSFNDLPITRQVEITRQIGTDRSLVLRDWASLMGAW